MRSLLRRLVLAALIAPAAVGVSMVASPAQAAPARQAQTPALQTLQADIARLTNAQRTAHGCAAVTVNAQLGAAAVGHSAWMARTGTFSHTGNAGSTFATRARAAGFARPAGENIAWGYRSATEVVTAWMKSPGHRANILNCRSRSAGVGAAVNAAGHTYYTQVFGY
ncbi:CAP domain-containing protein [Actinoplanes sp. NPDC049599]|uniref:CAP domain-containing protein n=1 Tax=Actinoplanes sp. NPDC049599 TaxID=3363903 RepID=UPI0037B2B082